MRFSYNACSVSSISLSIRISFTIRFQIENRTAMDQHNTKPVRRKLFVRAWYRRLLPSSSSSSTATTDKSLTALQLWGGIYHCKDFIASLGVKGTRQIDGARRSFILPLSLPENFWFRQSLLKHFHHSAVIDQFSDDDGPYIFIVNATTTTLKNLDDILERVRVYPTLNIDDHNNSTVKWIFQLSEIMLEEVRGAYLLIKLST